MFINTLWDSCLRQWVSRSMVIIYRRGNSDSQGNFGEKKWHIVKVDGDSNADANIFV